MNVITIKPEDASRWETYVQHCPRTVAWQSYAWNEAVRRNYRAEFLPLAAVDEGNIVGILPLYQMGGPEQPSRLYSVAYAVAGGLSVDSPAAQSALVNAAIELAQAKRAPGITFKQYRYKIDAPLTTDGNFFNRELALRLGRDRIWDQFDARNRARIEKAGKWSVRLEYPSQRTDLFYKMLLRHMTRQGVPGPSRQWVQTLLDLDMYGIALLERDGAVVAGTMVKTFKTTVSFPFTCLRDGSDDSLTAAYVLYWELIQQFARNNYEIFHSGRMPQSEDVDEYRRGWGGDKHAYFYQYHPEAQARTEFQSKRGWKRRVITACWKWLPTAVAGTIGPRIVAKFP